MNILIPHGFEANYAVGFAKGLAANGLHLQVISDDDSAGRLAEAGIENVNLRGSQKPGRTPFEKARSLCGYYWRLLRHLLRHRGSTIHFTGIFRNELVLLEGLVLHPCLKLLSRRYIYTAHNLLPHNRAHSRYYLLIYRFIYAVPDAIVVHAPGGKEQLVRQFGVPEDKIHVVAIGRNDEVPSTSLDRAAARRMLGAAAEENWILFFGKIDEYKGVDLLVDAFSGLETANARLLIAGAFRSDDCRKRLRMQIAASPRADKIRADFREIPNAEIEVLFKACDVLCLPYRHVYQSGVSSLATRFGMPLVATNVGPLADAVKAGRGVLAETNDARGISRALAAFFRARAAIDRSAVAAETENLRWDRLCRTILFLYEPPCAAGTGIPALAANGRPNTTS